MGCARQEKSYCDRKRLLLNPRNNCVTDATPDGDVRRGDRCRNPARYVQSRNSCWDHDTANFTTFSVYEWTPKNTYI